VPANAGTPAEPYDFTTMTTAGLLFMLISVGAVTGLFVWCLIKVLTGKKNPEHLAHVEPIETKDLDRR